MKYKVGMKVRNANPWSMRHNEVATVTKIDMSCIYFKYKDNYDSHWNELDMDERFEIISRQKPILTCKVEVPEIPNKIENLFRAVSMLEVED